MKLKGKKVRVSLQKQKPRIFIRLIFRLIRLRSIHLMVYEIDSLTVNSLICSLTSESKFAMEFNAYIWKCDRIHCELFERVLNGFHFHFTQKHTMAIKNWVPTKAIHSLFDLWITNLNVTRVDCKLWTKQEDFLCTLLAFKRIHFFPFRIFEILYVCTEYIPSERDSAENFRKNRN